MKDDTVKYHYDRDCASCIKIFECKGKPAGVQLCNQKEVKKDK